MPIVLLFGAFALIATSAYVFSQLMLARPSLKTPSEIQSLLTARSGVWHGIAILNRQGNEPARSSADTLEDLFSNGLFADEGRDQENDSATVDLAAALVPDGGPAVFSPFSGLRFGLCTLRLAIEGNFKMLHSVGAFRTELREVNARLGARAFPYPDTVLFLATAGMPEGGGIVHGRVHFMPANIDSSGGRRRSRFAVNTRDIEELVQSHSARLGAVLDTGIVQKELTVASEIDLDKVGETVSGPLLIDATYHDITWREKRTVIVQGDLQFTGEPVVEDLTFLVGGEVRIFDRAEMRNVTIFTQGRVFLAGESQFQGNVTAMEAVEIYEAAKVRAPSAIVSLSKLDGGGEGENTEEKKSSFSVFVRDRAEVDGVLMSARPQGGVSTSTETLVRGIIWSEGKVCHQGNMEGIIRARNLVSREDPDNNEKNFLTGTIRDLETIYDYCLPYYVGRLSIIDWSES